VLDVIRKLIRDKTSLYEAAETLLRYHTSSPLFLIRSLDGLKPWVSGMKVEDRADFSK
jgi:hypothetical protein